MKGIFITIEGGEGAGKSTLIRRLSQYLIQHAYPVITTREPGGTQLGEQIRRWLLNDSFKGVIGEKAELLLFLAARAQHIQEVIEPALNAGEIVICDRFNDSSIAYQGAGRGLGVEYTQQLCDSAFKLTPDLTFFLDVDPSVGLSRTRFSHKENAGAGKVDRIEAEKLEFHHRVRQAFLVLVRQHPQRIQVIDASASKEVVFQKVVEHVQHVLEV